MHQSELQNNVNKYGCINGAIMHTDKLVQKDYKINQSTTNDCQTNQSKHGNYEMNKVFLHENPTCIENKPVQRKMGKEFSEFEFEDVLLRQKIKAKIYARNVRTKIFRVLEMNNFQTQNKSYERFMVVVIVISLGLGIGCSTIQNKYENFWLHKLQIAVESFLLVVFLTEYMLRIWSSGAHGTYGAPGGWKKYVVTPHMIIDFLVILSSLATVVSITHVNGNQKRLLYLLQLLRVLRIDRQRGAFSAFWKVFKRHRKELLTCWYMGFLMVIFASFLVYAIEENAEPNIEPTMNDLFDGVYWGVISLTTIGYGDFSPNTTTGKILICCFAIFGTCFLAMPAGIIGSGFALQVAEHQKEKHVNRRRRPASILIQCYWRKYAADSDYPATWLPHTQTREEKRKSVTKTPKTDQMFGVPFTPILPTIHVHSESCKASPSHHRSVVVSSGELSPEELNQTITNGRWSPIRSLTKAEKIAVRFIRFLKCISSMKKFRQARRPYDERDILDQFASSQIEMFAKVRDLRTKIDVSQKSSDNKVTKTLNHVLQMEEQICGLKLELAETKLLLKLLLKSQAVDTNEPIKMDDVKEIKREKRKESDGDDDSTDSKKGSTS